MIVFAYDFETTGIDRIKDRIIEAGYILYSTGQDRILESAGFLVQSDGVPVTREITDINGITQAAVDKFGYTQEDVVCEFIKFANQADIIIGHNSNHFDWPMISAAAERTRVGLPTIKSAADTMIDIPGVKGEQLITMLAKVGVVMPSQHEAIADANGVILLCSKHAYKKPGERNWDKIKERADSPLVVLKSHQRRDRNADAKKFKFRWNDPLKGWFRIAKEMDIPQLEKEANFDFSRCDKATYPVWD